jgi:peptidase S41-like protein
MRKRSLLLVLVALPALVLVALTIRTPGRQARWLAEYEATRTYLATADANFDWVVQKKGIDLVALDSLTRNAVTRAWFSPQAALAVRSFVWKFSDGHTWARVRPAIWWNGLRAPSSELDTIPAHDQTPSPEPPTLLASMDASTACSIAGIDVNARPDGWDLPFPEAGAAELVADEEFPAVIVTLPDGRKVGILRVANFGHEHFGPTCVRAWDGFKSTLTAPCTEECRWTLVAAAMKNGAARAADVANELTRRGAVAVVVDITGNGGGSEFSDAMARALTATPLHIAPGGFIRHPLHISSLEDQRAGILDDTLRATAAQRPLLDRAVARIDSLLVEARRDCGRDVVWNGAAPSCSNTIITPPAVRYAAPGTFAGLENGWAIWGPSWHAGEEGRYRGPLLVLQDHRSASASEEFAARLRDNGAARIVGERSYGAGCGYSNGGTTLELTALGLLVRAPDCQRLRMDGSNETEGIAADVAAGWEPEDAPELRVRKAITAIERELRR